MSDLKRVKNICCHFTRNLAYYYAGNKDSKKAFKSNFWRIVNGNFSEIAILEFCKLFGGRNEKHRWINVVENIESFKASIEKEIGISFSEFEEYIEEIKVYRDKYLSHLDPEVEPELPSLAIAAKAVFVYYNYVCARGGFGGYPSDILEFYNFSLREAENIYPAVS